MSGPPHGRTIGFFNLFIIVFSAVGSGPSGIEGIIGSSRGVVLALVGIIVFPFVWGFVQALVSAELSIKYKQLNGAVGAWSKQLFGNQLAANVSLWVVLMQCSTAAFVSEVTLTYAQAYWSRAHWSAWERIGLTVGIIAVSAAINLGSIDFASRVMWIFSINSTAAFAALVGAAFYRGIDPSRLHGFSASVRTVRWDELVNLLIYNSAGYDAASSIISHVSNPRTNVPAAMVLVAVTIAVLYSCALVFPYLASKDEASAWQSGHFVTVARDLGGDWLALWILVSCLLTNLQIYVSALLTASYTVHSMAVANIFPASLGTKAASGAPRRAILACAFCSLLFGLAPLLVNLSVESVLYVFIMLTELACFLRDDGEHESTFRLSRRWRRAITVPPVALAMWVLVVQNRYVALATLAAVSLYGLWSIPLDKHMTYEQQVVQFYEGLSEAAKQSVAQDLAEGRPVPYHSGALHTPEELAVAQRLAEGQEAVLASVGAPRRRVAIVL